MPLARAFLTLLIVVAAPAIGSAQTLSFARVDHPSSSGPRAITTADFNRDGAMDLALANNGRKSISVLLNYTGQGQGFVLVEEIDLGGGPFDVTTGDMNNDMVVDLIVANADANTIDVILGDKAGGFRQPIRRGAIGNPRGVAVGDMDWDGRQDIVYTQYHFDSVQVLYGDGSGWNFVARTGPVTAGQRPQGVAVADLNWDGQPDIAVANTGASPLTVLYNAHNGTFDRVEIAGQRYLNVLTTGDFNSDGRTDIAAASTSYDLVAIYMGAEVGVGFSGAMRAGSSPRGIQSADLNKDGRPDLVTANRNANTVSVFLGRVDMPGAFTPASSFAAGAGSRDVALADFNFDGQMDIATANEYGSSTTVLSNTSRPPASLFWEARSLPTGNGGQSLALADFNNNGRIDVVYDYGIVLDGTTATTLTRLADQSWLYQALVGDFNNDGNTDIVEVAAHCSASCHTSANLHLGDGRGGFSHAGAFGRLGWSWDSTAADVNKDGRLDLVIVDAVSGVGTAHVLLGRTSGFSPAVSTVLPSMALGLDIDDVNRDGQADLVTAQSHGFSGVHIAYGDGSGRFAAGESLPSAREPRSVDAVDVNRDGAIDIVAGGDSAVVVWLGVTTGGFIPPSYWGDSNSENMIVGDFTGDGRVDIFLGSPGAVLRGRGDGSFAQAEPVNVAWEDGKAVDYDKDGRLDLVMTNYAHVMVLFNRAARGPNLPPVADAGPPRSIGYEWQFEDEIELGSYRSYDPNLDELSFEWQDAKGRIVSTEPVLYWPRSDPGTYTYTLIVRDGHGGEDRHTQTVTVQPFKEAIINVAYNHAAGGAWTEAADGTAAQEIRLWHPNTGAPKISTALADPADYVDVYFLADPTQRYKLWVRLKAEHNNWANDSVFIQFDGGAVTPGGRTRYAIGTTDALDVNLEQCSGCGIAEWGWRDERWGSMLTATPMLLQFPRGGWHRLRVQTREDGVSFDQIVLSSEQYRNAAPGSAKNDTTVLQPRPW